MVTNCGFGRTSLGKFSGRSRFWSAGFLLLFMSLFMSLLGWAGTRPHPAKTPGLNDSGYVLALGTANRFLHAWQMGDLETGMVLLSDRVRRAHNVETLEELFSSGSDRAYEIGRGKGHPGRYRFPVVLVTKTGGGPHRSFSEIVLVDTGKNDWAVDKLP